MHGCRKKKGNWQMFIACGSRSVVRSALMRPNQEYAVQERCDTRGKCREDYAHLDSNAMSEMERMQLEEAIQLSLALEESKKANQQAAYYAYQQGALNTDTDAFGVCLA